MNIFLVCNFVSWLMILLFTRPLALACGGTALDGVVYFHAEDCPRFWVPSHGNLNLLASTCAPWRPGLPLRFSGGSSGISCPLTEPAITDGNSIEIAIRGHEPAGCKHFFLRVEQRLFISSERAPKRQHIFLLTLELHTFCLIGVDSGRILRSLGLFQDEPVSERSVASWFLNGKC